jgi:hypothetical protein
MVCLTWHSLTGLLERSQADAGVDLNQSKAKLVTPKIRYGSIPGGSGCAGANDTTGIRSPVTSAIHIALGFSQTRDVAFVTDLDSQVFLGFFTVAGGFVVGERKKKKFMDKLRPIFGPTRYLIIFIAFFFIVPIQKVLVFLHLIKPPGMFNYKLRCCRTAAPEHDCFRWL